MNANTPPDRDLDRMLADAAALRDAYRRIASEEPSTEVDDAVRAAARRAAGSRPRLAGSPFSGSWRIPFSIAAVLVLSVTLTILVAEHDREIDSDGRSPGSTPVIPSESLKTQDAATKEEVDAPAIAPDAVRRKAGPADEQSKLAAPPAVPEAHEAQPAGAAPGTSSDTAVTDLRSEGNAAAIQQGPTAADQYAAPAMPSAAPEAAASAASGASGSAAVDEDAASGPDRAPSSMSGQRPPAERRGRAEAFRSDERRLHERETPAPQAAMSESMRELESNPQAWLRRIEVLLEANRIAEARESYRMFRERYPDYRLPPDFPMPPPP